MLTAVQVDIGTSEDILLKANASLHVMANNKVSPNNLSWCSYIQCSGTSHMDCASHHGPKLPIYVELKHHCCVYQWQARGSGILTLRRTKVQDKDTGGVPFLRLTTSTGQVILNSTLVKGARARQVSMDRWPDYMRISMYIAS